MNATQPSRPPIQPAKPPQVTKHKKRKHRSSSYRYRSVALEATAKLAANTVISAAAVFSLVHLLPYLWSQEEKWQEVHTQVKQTEGRVDGLQQDFSRYFDPHQAKTIMKEQSNRLEPGQSKVMLLNQSAKDVKKQ